MDNWEKGIVALNDTNVADQETPGPKPEDPKPEDPKSTRPKDDYLVTWETSSIVNDFQADLLATRGSPDNQALREHEIVKPKRMVSDHKNWRSKVIADREQARQKEKLKEERSKLQKLLVETSTASEKKSSVTDFLIEMATSRSTSNAFLESISEEDCSVLFAAIETAKARELELAPKRELDAQRLREIQARATTVNAQKQEDHKLSELNHHPVARWTKFFEQSKLVVPQPEETGKKMGDEEILELPIDWSDPQDIAANYLIRQEVIDQKDQRLQQAKANQFTTNVADLMFEEQPRDVFERMWTPITESNPVIRAYRILLKNLKLKSEQTNKQVSGCQKCFTVFRLKFPAADWHLHIPSPSFKTAMNAKVIARHDRDAVGLSKEESLRACFQYDALVALAKEAGAYKEESGVKFIKMLRVAEGKRRPDGCVIYDRCEICGNPDIEVGHEEVANTRFRIGKLAEGLLAIIVEMCVIKPGGIPEELIKPLHHGAGLESFFRNYSHLVPEFRSELIFRAFLIAFGNHVRSAYKLDSASHPVTHWWRGIEQIKNHSLFFIDSSRGNARTIFDTKGRAKLAHNLAEKTFKVLELYFTTEQYAGYLKKHDNANALSEAEEKVDCLDDSVLDAASTHDGCESTSEFKEKELLQITEAEAMRRKKISKSMLKKRKPEPHADDEGLGLPPWFPGEEVKAYTNTERSRKHREKETSLERKQRSDQEAERRKRIAESETSAEKKQRLAREAEKQKARRALRAAIAKEKRSKEMNPGH